MSNLNSFYLNIFKLGSFSRLILSLIQISNFRDEFDRYEDSYEIQFKRFSYF